MAGTTQYFGISYPTATDYVKDGASNMQTIATGFDSAVAIPVYNNQTGTSYTFVLADAAKTVTSNNAGAVTFTIPPQSSVAWATGTTLNIYNYGAGAVTFAGGSGVTVTNTAGTVAQYRSAKVVRTGSDAWTVVPQSGGASGLTLLSSTTVTTQNSVNFTSAFSSTYANYKIFMYVTGASGNDTLYLKLLSGSTPLSSGYYTGYMGGTLAGGTNGFGQTNDTSGYWIGDLNANNDTTVGEYTIYKPNLAIRTSLVGGSFNQYSTNTYSRHGGGYQNNQTAYDGFQIYTTGTSFSGVIRVYGVQN